jgi:hypothetical protein
MHYVKQAATFTRIYWVSHNDLFLVLEHNNTTPTSCVCIATPPNRYRNLRVLLIRVRIWSRQNGAARAAHNSQRVNVQLET